MKVFILLTALLISPVTRSAVREVNKGMEDNYIIRGGLSFLSVFFKTGSLIDNTEHDEGEVDTDETNTPGYGFTTSVARRWTDFELLFGSDVYFGQIKDLTFISENKSIRGSGHFRVVNLGPTAKYITPLILLNKAQFYVGAGPNWSLQTFVFSDVVGAGGFNNNNRVSFENYGGNIYFGIEEITPDKSSHPTYLEFGYSYMSSYKVSIHDASKQTDVITLSEKSSRKFSGHYFIIRLGMTLF